MTFAIVTLTTLFVVQQLAFNLHSLTKGSTGLMLPTPSFPIDNYDRPFYLAMLALLLTALALCWLILRSKLGLMLLAIREDEEKARGLGIRVTGAKLIAWSLWCGHRDGRRRLGVLPHLHLPAVGRRPARDDRRRADDLPRRPGNAVGADRSARSCSCRRSST